jgi:hypothetical protein
MLYYFLLIIPTGFKGVLTTYHIWLSSYFPNGFFWGRDSKDDRVYKEHNVYKGILMDTQEDFKTIQEDLEDYTTDFQETALSKGEC